MVQALDSGFSMATESSTGTLAFKRNRTVIVAFWILGLIAAIEAILAAIAFAPRIAAVVRPAGQSVAVTPPTNAPFQQHQQLPAQENVDPAPSAPVSFTDSRPQNLTPSPVRDALGEKDADILPRPPQSESRVSDKPSLQILYAKLETTEEGSKVLRVAIKSGMREKVDGSMVKVQVYFYDQDENGEVIPSKAQVTSKWPSAPVDWQKPQILEVRYFSDSADPGLRFYGYVVAIYYKENLQDSRPEPSRLIKLFPLKHFIAPDEL